VHGGIQVTRSFYYGVRRGMRGWRCAVGLLALAVLAGCASGVRPSELSDEQRQAASADYLIGPGDTLRVFVWHNPELSGSVPVRPDGKLSVPLVGDIQAANKTPMQLAADVEEQLTEYVNAPNVTVIVESFQGDTAQQIRVVGQAVEPRAIQFARGMTLLDAMIQVGGLSEFAAGNRGKVVRRRGDDHQEIRVRLDDLLNGGDMSQNLTLMPGDVVVIPETRF